MFEVYQTRIKPRGILAPSVIIQGKNSIMFTKSLSEKYESTALAAVFI